MSCWLEQFPSCSSPNLLQYMLAVLVFFLDGYHDNYCCYPCDRPLKLVAFPSVQTCRVIDQPLRHSVNCLGSFNTGTAQPGDVALLKFSRRYRPVGSVQAGDAGDKDLHYHQPMTRFIGNTLLSNALHPDYAGRLTDDPSTPC